MSRMQANDWSIWHSNRSDSFRVFFFLLFFTLFIVFTEMVHMLFVLFSVGLFENCQMIVVVRLLLLADRLVMRGGRGPYLSCAYASGE